MSTVRSFEALEGGATRLADALGALQVTVVEDAPHWGRTMAVDELGDAVTELCSEGQRLSGCVGQLEANATVREDAREILAQAQSALNAIADGLEDRARADHVRAELDRLGLRSGGEWRAWVSASLHGIAECTPALRDTRDALNACWQELADSGGVRVDHASVARVTVNDEGRGPRSRSLRSSPQIRSRVGIASTGDDEIRGGNR